MYQGSGLIHKLECMGVSGPLLAWLRSFLSGRTQLVVINGMGSDFLLMNAGVPQGSVLAPYSSLCSSMTCSTTSTCVLPRLNATTPTYWIRSFIPPADDRPVEQPPPFRASRSQPPDFQVHSEPEPRSLISLTILPSLTASFPCLHELLWLYIHTYACACVYEYLSCSCQSRCLCCQYCLNKVTLYE